MRIGKYLNLLAENCRNMFFDGVGVSAVSIVLDPTLSSPNASNFRHDPLSGYLEDPYEGEMFFFFMCWYGLSEQECSNIWVQKRKMMQSIEYQNTTVQKGWWFSSHEQWKVKRKKKKTGRKIISVQYMFLPYMDEERNFQLFVNGERARTFVSSSASNPCLFASINNVTSPGPGRFSPGYLSANGISDFAFSPSSSPALTICAPYAR